MPLYNVARLSRDIERMLAEAKVPGCSIAAVERGGALWTNGFGMADLSSKRAARPDTIYHLFSGTKLFTATAILQLFERGKLTLETPVARYLPDIGAPPAVTIEHLLSHRSGLKDTLKAMFAVTIAPAEPPDTRAALSAFQIKAEKPPGRVVEYRNVNYAILGEVVARVSGLDYKTYVARHILAPLHSNASFAGRAIVRPSAAVGYMDRFDSMRLALATIAPEVSKSVYAKPAGAGRYIALKPFNLNASAIGGLVGAMDDFAPFLAAQLSDGGPILSAETTRRMQTLVASGAPGVVSQFGMGLGWKIGRLGERFFLNHEGGGPGFTSELRLYPEHGLGIALGMNIMRMPETMQLAHEICELVLAEQAV